jgi:mycothiol system anti-sigma-R factor
MKCCDNNEATIRLYLDNELSGQDVEEFRAHLKECEACQTELDAESRLSALLHRSRPLYVAPDALRARVMHAAESFSPITMDAVVNPRRRLTTVLAQPLRFVSRRAHSWGALVTASLLVAACLLVVPAILRLSNANSYIGTAVAAHHSFLNGNLPLEIQSGSPGVVTAWFAGKLPFTFRLPSSAAESGHEHPYQLIGGRLINYKCEYAALVAYQMQQEKISLLVSSGKSAVAAGGEEVPSGGIVFHYSKRASFNVITWSNHGLTYALVSSLPGSGRRSCLVCHQNMADGDRFNALR